MKKIFLFLMMFMFSFSSFAQLQIVDRHEYPFRRYSVIDVDNITFSSSKDERVYLIFRTDLYSKTFDITSFSEQAANTIVDVQDYLDVNGGTVYVYMVGYEHVWAISTRSFRKAPQYVYVFNSRGSRYLYDFYRPYVGYMRPYVHHHRPYIDHRPHRHHAPAIRPQHNPNRRPIDKPNYSPKRNDKPMNRTQNHSSSSIRQSSPVKSSSASRYGSNRSSNKNTGGGHREGSSAAKRR